MALPFPPPHLPGIRPNCGTTKGVVHRLHNRRIVVGRLPNGNCYAHFSIALKPGEAEEIRRDGHVDCATDYILRDRVRYWVLILTGEAMDALTSGWQHMQGLARQRQKRKRV